MIGSAPGIDDKEKKEVCMLCRHVSMELASCQRDIVFFATAFNASLLLKSVNHVKAKGQYTTEERLGMKVALCLSPFVIFSSNNIRAKSQTF